MIRTQHSSNSRKTSADPTSLAILVYNSGPPRAMVGRPPGSAGSASLRESPGCLGPNWLLSDTVVLGTLLPFGLSGTLLWLWSRASSPLICDALCAFTIISLNNPSSLPSAKSSNLEFISALLTRCSTRGRRKSRHGRRQRISTRASQSHDHVPGLHLTEPPTPSSICAGTALSDGKDMTGGQRVSAETHPTNTRRPTPPMNFGPTVLPCVGAQIVRDDVRECTAT